jgi:hypothetical protein
MAAIDILPTERTSTATAAVANLVTAGTASAAVSFIWADDPFIESPMTFVEGVEAHPERGSEPEPSGSGPFGF